MRKYNFSSGPAVLPMAVLQQSAAGIQELAHQGVSIAEISHRDHLFIDILEEILAIFHELLQLSDEHEVIILQGGARLQFAQIPMNFLLKDETAGFVDSGYWAHKAMEYAHYFGQTRLVGSSASDSYHSLPVLDNDTHDLKYIQLTSNNTIYGTQYRQLPRVKRPLIVDMSSDILSIQRDFSQIDLAFACAQKNIGPAGLSVVIVKKSFLEKATQQVPPVFSYKNLAAKRSNYATPPVVNVYMSLLNLRWLKKQGGVAEIAKINDEKASLLYTEIDRNPLLYCPVQPSDRSRMNVCFKAINRETENKFLQFCADRDIVGIKGHAAAGAMRASIYNAQSLENVQYLISVMREFEQQF